MQTAAQWLDIFKARKSFKSDYQLARYWNVSTATVSQYRSERLRLPVCYCLEIAQACYYHPLEIILSLEYGRAKEKDKAIIEQVYWLATVANAGERMSARAFSTKWYRYRKK